MLNQFLKNNSQYVDVAVLSWSLLAFNVYADDSEFNTAFLKDVTDQVVFEAVTKGYSILPGEYEFTIYINNQRIDKRVIKFYEQDQSVVPCIDARFIEDYQIILNLEKSATDKCYDLTSLPEAKLSFDAGLQTLNISIPQIFLQQNIRGFIPAKFYDQGINALIVNYNANSSMYKNKSGENHINSSLFLNSGFNYGAWRYRNQSSFSKYSDQEQQWDNVINKLERDILPLRARLEIGDTTTRNDVFDSINFRGLQFSSDDAQLPIGLQNYAPIIRGTALSNALVEVRQNNYLVYSMNVAAGNFEIKDLYAANQSGDLEIRIIESDGSIRKFTQPYSSVPNMLRAGQNKYQITGGQYKSGSSDYQPYFGQLSYTLGLNNYITPYTGVLVAEDYYAVAGGFAWSLGHFGAFSTDLSYANNTLSNGRQEDGLGLRILYAKSLNTLGTDIRFSGYHYTSKGYYGFADAVQEKAQWKNGRYEYTYSDNNLVDDSSGLEDQQTDTYYSNTYYSKKNQYQISLSQQLGKWGQMYANLSDTQYWQKDYNQRNWQIGYNNNFQRLSYGMYYQNSKNLFNGSDYSLGINFSLPIDQYRKIKKYDLSSNNNYQYSPSSGSIVQTSLSGNFLEDKNLQIQAQIGHSETSANNFNLNAAYRGTKANSNFGYGYTNDNQQFYAGMNGGILVHSNGIIFGQQLNSSPILVEAKGAQNIRVENQTGLKIDKNGYAIISSSNAYARNRVALQAEDLGQNISIDDLVKTDIVPTKYAIVKVKFDVKTGHSVLVNLAFKGKELATGTDITEINGLSRVGLVGLNGQAYLTNVESGQTLMAKWGEAVNQQCQFSLPQLSNRAMGYDELTISCEAGEHK